MSSARHYCFTLNNPAKNEIDFSLYDCVRYAVWQREIGSKGTPHLQGYLELSAPRKFSTIVNKIPDLKGAHFEARRGTREEAREYCRKEETNVEGPWEYGEWESGGQGARNDLTAVLERIKSGATERDILIEFPAQYFRYATNIKRALQLLAPKRDFKTTVTVVFGDSGVGKSRLAHQRWPDAFWKQPENKWFDGYCYEKTIILDDFKPGCLQYTTLLRLMDRYPLTVETKGSSVNVAPDELVLTTNVLPSLWYKFDGKKMKFMEITRRIDKIIWFMPVATEEGTEVVECNSWEAFETAFGCPILPPDYSNFSE